LRRLLAGHHIKEVLRRIEVRPPLDRLLAVPQPVERRRDRREARRQLDRFLERRQVVELVLVYRAQQGNAGAQCVHRVRRRGNLAKPVIEGLRQIPASLNLSSFTAPSRETPVRSASIGFADAGIWRSPSITGSGSSRFSPKMRSISASSSLFGRWPFQSRWATSSNEALFASSL